MDYSFSNGPSRKTTEILKPKFPSLSTKSVDNLENETQRLEAQNILNKRLGKNVTIPLGLNINWKRLLAELEGVAAKWLTNKMMSYSPETVKLAVLYGHTVSHHDLKKAIDSYTVNNILAVLNYYQVDPKYNRSLVDTLRGRIKWDTRILYERLIRAMINKNILTPRNSQTEILTYMISNKLVDKLVSFLKTGLIDHYYQSIVIDSMKRLNSETIEASTFVNIVSARPLKLESYNYYTIPYNPDIIEVLNLAGAVEFDYGFFKRGWDILNRGNYTNRHQMIEALNLLSRIDNITIEIFARHGDEVMDALSGG